MTVSTRIAHAVSALGHPLMTIAVFVIFVALREGDAVLPLRYAFLIVAALVIPVAAWNLRQTRTGRYENFDVSVRTQRASMYAVVLVLLIPITIAMKWAPVSRGVRVGMVCIASMFVAASAINFAGVKLSLHAAVSFFVAIVCTSIDLWFGLVLFACAVAVAASRLVLRRHTALEVWLGASLGIATGLAFQLAAP